MRLTCHLGLVGCENTFVSVGDETRPYEDGKCVVFGARKLFFFFFLVNAYLATSKDDSFVHSVAHKGTQRRVTLMLDFWHPKMTNV